MIPITERIAIQLDPLRLSFYLEESTKVKFLCLPEGLILSVSTNE